MCCSASTIWFFFSFLAMNVRVNADPDSERTVFNNRNQTLSGASVWFHGSRQSCLNITLTLLVPHWGAPPHRLHSSYFYWRQEEFVSKYGCVRLSPCEAWKWLLQVRVMCAMFMLVKRKYLFSGNIGWVVWGGGRGSWNTSWESFDRGGQILRGKLHLWAWRWGNKGH